MIKMASLSTTRTRGGWWGPHGASLIVFLGMVITTSVVKGQVSLGKFVYNGHGLRGEVIILNERQYRIKGFSYDGAGPAVWHMGMRRGTAGVYSEGGYAFRNENGNCNRLSKRYSNSDVIITLPKNMNIVRDLESISVYCYRFCHNFGHVKVPRNLKVPAAPRNLKNSELCRPNYPTCSKDRTRDNAVCKRNNGQEDTCPVSQAPRRQKSGGNRGGSSSTAVALPSGRNLSGNNNRFNRNLGPQRIGRFISYANGVVGEITVLNDKQFRVKGFGYNGARGSSTYFLLMEKGNAGIYSVKAWAVPDENGRCNGLRSYRNSDLVITVPNEISLSRDVGAIAVYDYEKCQNFGHVRVPNGLSVGGGPKNGGRGGRKAPSVCLPYFRPCSRRDTRNPGVCSSRRGGQEVTC